MIGPGGLLLVVPTYLQSPFQFIGGLQKKKTTKLGCKKYFCRVTSEHRRHRGDALSTVAMVLACQRKLVGKAIESKISFHGSLLPYSWDIVEPQLWAKNKDCTHWPYFPAILKSCLLQLSSKSSLDFEKSDVEMIFSKASGRMTNCFFQKNS